MPLLLTETERLSIRSASREMPFAAFFRTLLNRVERRTSTLPCSPFASDGPNTLGIYSLTDAAMALAINPSEKRAAWLHHATLDLIRCSPWSIGNTSEHRNGTQKVIDSTIAVAVVLDLAAESFNAVESDEALTVLRHKWLPFCLRHLERHDSSPYERCAATAALAIGGVLLGDPALLQRAMEAYHCCIASFRPDGSHGESLQTANRSAEALILAREVLLRHTPSLAADFPLDIYSGLIRWNVYSHFYKKPLSGWGPYDLPRTANFRGSDAVARPQADLLLYIANRAKDPLPTEAGLARWLFNELYLPYIEPPHEHQAGRQSPAPFGFLTLPLYTEAANPISPDEAGLPLIASFECGDIFARDSWSGRTILAVRTAGAQAVSTGSETHHDHNSFILVHNRERLLVDPGQSCPQNLLRELEASSLTHNTCVFSNGRSILQQRQAPPAASSPHGTLLAERSGHLSVIISEAAPSYGPPLETFTRYWFLCGTHALFIVDRITSTYPLKTTWNWLFNQRDGWLDFKPVPPDRLVARRGEAGMKLFHLGHGLPEEPLHGYLHDAGHTLPNQPGEGKAGSALLVRWSEKEPNQGGTTVHAIAMDHSATLPRWHLKRENGAAILENESISWQLRLNEAGTLFHLTEVHSGEAYSVDNSSGRWQLRTH